MPKLSEISEKIGLNSKFLCEDVNIKNGYCCDLLSEVMGKAKEGSIWVTVHNNMNVVAVASMLDLKAVIITEGHKANDEFLKKAKEESISVFETNKDSFDVVGKLFELGIKG
ncbi:DRTGG domain-containing protein [Haliovirga abyssi]|uniref:DRTGG domain-containing protein n=1 Tax=Haliovirga abyssi TaxID=2996794 RepID=A0AAU9DWF1_9FUSO|nr:DRTGG domain-containing protein [Haliovirga abyssi]BDU50596.1 hypothetical protein HLVA_11650 [Haliovirga abyssi]